MQNWQQAEQAYEEATRVAPNNILAHLEFAHYRFRRDLTDDRTVEALERAFSLAEVAPSKSVDLPSLYTELALGYLRTGRLLLAEEAARNAIALNPNLYTAYHMLGDALRRQGDNWGAIEAYKKALALGGTNSWIHFGLAAAYIEVGDLANAREEAQRLAVIDPQHPGLPALLDELDKLETLP
jgi:Tfp pilus assembly protein PilF